LYNRTSQGLIHHLQGHAATIAHLRFSPDGKQLLSADEDGNLVIWDTSTGKAIATPAGHTGPIHGLTFGLEGDLYAWGTNTAWQLHPSDAALVHSTSIYSGTIFAVSPVGDAVAVSSGMHMSIWDATTGDLQVALDGEAEDVFVDYWDEGAVFPGFNEATFSDDGQLLLAADTGGTWSFDVSTGQAKKHFPGFNVFAVESSPNGEWLLTCHYSSRSRGGGWLEMLDAQAGSRLYRVQEADCWHNRFAFSPDNQWIGVVTNSWQRESSQFVLVNTASGQETNSLPFEEDVYLSSLAFSPDGRLAAIGQSDGKIHLVDLASFQIVATLEGHRGNVNQLAFSQDGWYLASGSEDGTLKLWGVK